MRTRALVAGLAAVALAAPAAAQEVAEPQDFVRPLAPQDFVRPLRLGDSVLSLQRTRERRGRVRVDVAADVLFEFDRAALTPTARDTLARIARRLGRVRGTVLVEGHTDALGTTAYNRRLSGRRARAVAGALPGRLRVRAVGRGESRPVAPNTRNGEDNPAGRARNRRVTISARSR